MKKLDHRLVIKEINQIAIFKANRLMAQEPLLVVKMNREKPLAIIELDHFIELQKEEN
jgi:hypothetical protein